MAKIVSVHSFRGGTGKSNTTAALACILAREGHRVGIVDTDIQSPGIHVLFDLDQKNMQFTLNAFLWGKCDIVQAAYDVTPKIGQDAAGTLFLVPSSILAGDIARVLQYGYDVNLLKDGCLELIRELNLDALFIDTHPGLNEETLMSIAISDLLLIILRPDQQDYQGTAVTVDVSRQLDVPAIRLLVNKAPESFHPEELAGKIASAYGCEVLGVIPHMDEMMSLGSSGLFPLRYPEHKACRLLEKIAGNIEV